MIQAGQLLALALVPVVLLAACGGDDVAAFREHRLVPLEHRVDQQRARLAALLRGLRPGSTAGARALQRQALPLDQAGKALATLDAPSGVGQATHRYGLAASGLARELRSFAAAIRSRGTVRIRDGAAAVRAAVGALQQARITLDEAVAR